MAKASDKNSEKELGVDLEQAFRIADLLCGGPGADEDEADAAGDALAGLQTSAKPDHERAPARRK
jgi:hypothetical protein